MPKYYGTITITLDGIFEADGIEEIQDDPEGCVRNYTIETEIVCMDEMEEED